LTLLTIVVTISLIRDLFIYIDVYKQALTLLIFLIITFSGELYVYAYTCE